MIDRFLEARRLVVLPTDDQIVEKALAPAVKYALNKQQEAARRQEDRERYEKDREAWIAAHGSPRLKRSAERGYKHDGAYKEERLEAEFPGFVASLGKDIEVGEVFNPTEAALDVETEVLEQVAAADSDGLGVRLVWVTLPSGGDWREGNTSS